MKEFRFPRKFEWSVLTRTASQVWKHCAWLVVDSFISAGKVVNCVISLTDRIQVFRGARVTRILRTTIKTQRV